MAASSSGEVAHMAAVVEMDKGPHLRSIDCAEMMTSKRRSRRSFELAGGGVFAVASELGDGAACSAMVEARRLVLANGRGETRRRRSK